jgi:hypothetical protein
LYAELALRIRVSMSAIGSVMTMRSPGRLGHTGDVSLVGQLAKTDAAQHEPTVHGPGPAAPGTPGIGPDPEFLSGSPLLLDQRLLRHVLPFVILT